MFVLKGERILSIKVLKFGGMQLVGVRNRSRHFYNREDGWGRTFGGYGR
jgi:hypothetical protein